MNLKPFKKDAGGYGNLDMANQHESDKETPIRLGSDGKKEESETYIGLPARNGKNMTLNKIQHTNVGDDIHFYVNGVENRGIVVKMGGTYISVFKEDGNIHEIPIDETFFVKDILINKTWDDMSGEERTELLQNARAYSPRFLNKNWDELPRELKTVLSEKATGMEQNHDKDNLEKEEANHAVTGYAQTQQNTLGKIAPLVGAGLGAAVGAGVGRAAGAAVGSYAGKKLAEHGEKKEAEKQALPSVGLSSETAVEAEHRGDKNPTRGRHPKKGMDGTLKAILELKSDVEEGRYGNVGSTSNVGVSTDTALDVTEGSGYEERPHVSLEEVGEYPRTDAKTDHHANEISEPKSKHPDLEPKFSSPASQETPRQGAKKTHDLEHAKEDINEHIKEMKKKGEDGQTGSINTSEGGAFNPIYNAYDTPITPEETKTGRKISGRDQIKKGVPLSNVDTWGIRYVTKEDIKKIAVQHRDGSITDEEGSQEEIDAKLAEHNKIPAKDRPKFSTTPEKGGKKVGQEKPCFYCEAHKLGFGTPVPTSDADDPEGLYAKHLQEHDGFGANPQQ